MIGYTLNIYARPATTKLTMARGQIEDLLWINVRETDFLYQIGNRVKIKTVQLAATM